MTKMKTWSKFSITFLELKFRNGEVEFLGAAQCGPQKEEAVGGEFCYSGEGLSQFHICATSLEEKEPQVTSELSQEKA